MTDEVCHWGTVLSACLTFWQCSAIMLDQKELPSSQLCPVCLFWHLKKNCCSFFLTCHPSLRWSLSQKYFSSSTTWPQLENPQYYGPSSCFCFPVRQQRPQPAAARYGLGSSFFPSWWWEELQHLQCLFFPALSCGLGAGWRWGATQIWASRSVGQRFKGGGAWYRSWYDIRYVSHIA